MSRFCTQCGAPAESGAKHCTQCGAALSVPAPAPSPEPAPAPKPAPAPSDEKKIAKASKKQNKKAKKGKGWLVALIVIFSVIALIALLVFAFGNYITLKFHTDKVLDSLNSGNLDLSEFQSDPYEDLPLYVIEMMGETSDPSELGPVVSAMAPYLTFEIKEIHGFFGGSEVEYRIVSRDLGGWLLSLDYSAIGSSEELQKMMIDYIPEAPLKEHYVTVKYYRDGLFGWKGNYEIPEFADALTGGLNTAYNALYDEMIEEMEDILG